MRFRPLAVATFSALALALPSCSANDQSREDRQAEASDATSPPDISPTAAPGIAFHYAYQFSLPDERISASQEAHPSDCEKLGLARCRITGMSYTVDQDEQVSAELSLALDPAIARQFGKSAQHLIETNDGQLIRLDIGSANEGQSIEQATTQKSNVSAQLAQLQQELARTKAGSDAHASILGQIQALQRQSAEQSRAIQASEAALANTPMTFHYYGRGGVPGFRGNPVRAAWQTFVTTVVTLVQVILQTLAVLLPLALLAALVLLISRTRPIRALARWIRRRREVDE